MHAYLNQIVDFLLAQSWQIAVLTVAVAVAAFALKNRSAHVRYLLWLIVLAKCLMPPLLTIPLAILPRAKPAERIVTTSPPEIVAADHEAADTAIVEPVEHRSVSFEPASAPAVTRRAKTKTVREWGVIAWMIGAGVYLAMNLLRALRANCWLRRKRSALSAGLRAELENMFSAYGFRRLPRIWLMDDVGQPFVWGLLRGNIYLPANFVGVSDRQREKNILGHELSHIVRFDAAVNFLQVIAQAIFWFHPFVWWANKKIRKEREKCCDEMAIARLNAVPKDYSTSIVEILEARKETARPVPSLAVAGPARNIEERIRSMLRPGREFYKRPSLIASVAVLLLATLVVPTALVLTAQADSKTDEGDETLTRKSTEETLAAYAYTPVSDPNLVAWWRLDDGSGSSARDSSGNDNHGTLHGDAQWTTGRIGGALDFDGDGDYVDCGNPEIFNFDEQVTAGAWINLRSIPGPSRAVVAKGEDGWRLALTRKTPGFHFAVAGRAFGYPGIDSARQATFGEWHHVCGTYDGQMIRVYIDGQTDGTFNYTHGIATNNVNLRIGDNPQVPGRRLWDGLIDEVFVFNRALSKGEIRVAMQGLSNPALAQKPSPADQVKTNSVGMKLVWIPPGEFMMGSKLPPGEVTRRYNGSPVRYQNEHPQRKVTLTRAFWMAESEVTQAQYRAIMGSDPSHSKGDNLPVEMVSWHDAMEFCRKLSLKEGRTYTLPTEAQWEYSARAGTDTAYCFGNDAGRLGDYAWYAADSGWTTQAVKKKKPNAFGLYDVHGNVWEWCLDWYGDSYDGLGHVDPIGPRSGQSRVARGGSWHAYAGAYRSAVREGYNPDARNRYRDVGFRVVLLVAGAD